MVLLLIFEFILKAVLQALGLLAWKGLHWAAVVFVVLLCVLGLIDFVLACTVYSAHKDIDKKLP